MTAPLQADARPPAMWVAEQLSALESSSALCLFTGTGALPRALRKLGWSVTTLDVLESSLWWNRAFVQEAAPLGERRLGEWLKLRKEPEVVKRFLPWAGRYFTPEETIWLGIWHRHILSGEGSVAEQAIGVVAVYWSIRYWLSWNRTEMGFKPLTPSAVFRHYVEQANRMLLASGLQAGRAERLPSELVLTQFDADLLWCYVAPLEGIGTLGLAQRLCEQWTLGDPGSTVSEAAGALGAGTSGAPILEEALLGLLLASEAVPNLALAYHGPGGSSLEALVGDHRSIVSRQELSVPYPGAHGSSIIIQGLLIAGAPHGARTKSQANDATDEEST